MDIGALKAADILGVVLAGGQSRRFGQDKAIAPLNGRPLIAQVVSRAMPQVVALAISGRDYGLGLPVIPDIMASEGPLTGILSAMRWAADAGFAGLATLPCDAPFFPFDLVARLAGRLTPSLGCSFVGSRTTRHPIFAVWRVSALARLEEIYASGTRSLMAAQDRLGCVAVDFAPGEGPGGDMFFNINDRNLQALAQTWLACG